MGPNGPLLCHWADPPWQAGLPARELDPEHLLHLRGVRRLDARAKVNLTTCRQPIRRPDENFGGLKNSHDGMCVHNSAAPAEKGWGY